MKKVFTRQGRAGLLLGAGIAALTVGSPALAQDRDDPRDGQEENEEELDAPSDDEPFAGDNAEPTSADAGAPETGSGLIIVSGSRIARPNLDSTVPVTTVDAGEVLDGGAVSLGDALNDLPSLRSTFNSSNSQRFIGTTGVNFLDLRGLGTARTLVLVNGRRHITSSAGDFQVDVNTIPFELLERVDVVTGGSSAVYGSDAIAGVVNFVLKRDFEGLEVNGIASLTDRGDYPQYGIGITAGQNFADGRGNVAVSAEYTKVGAVLNSQRPEISGFNRGFTSFVTTDTDTLAENPTNSDGIPDTTLISGQRLDFISEGGTVQNFCIFGPAVQPLSCAQGGGIARFRFGQDGRLFREVNDTLSNGNAVGGTGSVLADGSLLPDIERYNINLLARYDVSDAFRPYFEAKYARIEALGQGTPTFFNSFCGGLAGASGLDPSCADGATSAFFFVGFDNPFLNPDDAATLSAVQDELLGGFGIGPGASQGFFINRNNSDFGTRNDQIKRETYRFVAGFEGDISSNTRYDISATYGKFESRLDAQNQIIYQNTRNALDSVRDGSGNIVCRINADADTTNDDAACVPLNPFGFGSPSQAALDYILATANLFEEAEQFDVLGFVNTDSSSFFELPGGPISVVVGGEYRREEASRTVDPLSASGATFFNAFADFNPPVLEVIEAFGEISIPLLANLPFADELTLSAAGRVSDYNSGAGNTGTVEAWNLNAIYAPIPDIRFRANLSRAVRSPTLDNLFSPATENFVFLDDPCDARFINNGPNPAVRQANCASNTRLGGVPVGFTDPVTGNRSVNQGGNQFLEAETSDSLTLGVILEPRFVPGFSLTVDYYDIEVDSVIANIGGNQILNNCFDATNFPANQFCDLIADRQPDGSLQSTGALNIAPVNFAKLTAEGIDFDARYTRTFDNDDRISLRLILTYALDRTNFLDIDNPELPNRVLGELGDPEVAFNFGASYRTGPITLSYDLRWIDRQTIGAYENYFPFQAECPASGFIPRTDPPQSVTCTAGSIVEVPASNPDFTEERFYPRTAFHDVRLDLRVQDQFNFFFGVDNITDELPPFGLTGGGAGSGIFSNRGRTLFAGFNAEF